MITLGVSVFILLSLGISVRWNWWRLKKPGIPILMYHKIGIAPEGSKLKQLWVSSEKFRRQLSYLKERGYTPITFQDLYRKWDNGGEFPRKPILLTFDDGYKNNYEQAGPILQEFGFKATLFVVVETIGKDNVWHDPKSEVRIPMISWEELKKLQTMGWEIGSHTLTHPRLSQLEKNRVQIELEKSRQIIGENLPAVPSTLAYPYGNGEDVASVRECAVQAGYRVAVGVHAGLWTEGEIRKRPYQLPRLFVRGDESMWDFHLQVTRGKSHF